MPWGGDGGHSHGQKPSPDKVPDAKAEGIIQPLAPGPREEYQDITRCIFFRHRGASAAEAAAAIQRPLAWVEQRWALEASSVPVPRAMPPYVRRHALSCLEKGVEPFRPADLRRGFFEVSPEALRSLASLPWGAAPVLKRDYASGAVRDSGIRVERQRCSPKGLRTGVPCVDEALRRIQAEFNVDDPGAYLLCNRYPDGRASIAPHQHDFCSATLVIGAPRAFVLDDRSLELRGGDVLVFGSQRHSVPRVSHAAGERVSVSLFWYPEWLPDWYGSERIAAWAIENEEADRWAAQRAVDVQSLQSMGFSEAAALAALDEEADNLDAAVARLVQGSCSDGCDALPAQGVPGAETSVQAGVPRVRGRWARKSRAREA